jgi:hypothetical protein
MQLSPAIFRPSTVASQARPASYHHVQSLNAISAEIYAYIATRDMAFADAERTPTDLILNRAYLANELVENCLKPVRSPYQAQSLTTVEAARESQRCEIVKSRIANLRACAVAAA